MHHLAKKLTALAMFAALFLLPASWAAAEGLESPSGPASSMISPLEHFNQYMRERLSPTEMVGVTGSVRHPSRYGPKRNDPTQGVPRNAYSPFADMQARDIHCPSGGCDFVPGVVLIKLEPEVAVARHLAVGEQFSEPDLNRVLQEEMLSIEPLFPQAVKPDPAARVVRADGVQEHLPDLTLWHRVTLNPQARAARDATDAAEEHDPQDEVSALVRRLANTKGVAHAEPDYLRKPILDLSDETPLAQRQSQDVAAPSSA